MDIFWVIEAACCYPQSQASCQLQCCQPGHSLGQIKTNDVTANKTDKMLLLSPFHLKMNINTHKLFTKSSLLCPSSQKMTTTGRSRCQCQGRMSGKMFGCSGLAAG